MEKQRQYIAIDLKSFYASVECVERGLDPLATNLVVADNSRTDKTICLAVTPSLKAYGISGRARLFEVVRRVREVNLERLCFTPTGDFTGRSWHDPDLQRDPSLELDYIVAQPRMRLYMDYSARIYCIYLRFFAPEDVYSYSIDEVFIDVTDYLASYRMTARELTAKVIREVLRITGITATAGIGPNIYLCKVAMDIVAKHLKPDADGVRIAELDEMGYRRQLWDHRPLTDFWRVGRGISRRLEAAGMMTMGDLARRSLTDEPQLRRMFGVNAELLIDHAWGWEEITIHDARNHKPKSHSFSASQVLMEPYTAAKARVVAREMADAAALRLVEKGMVCGQVSLHVNYDVVNLRRDDLREAYDGPVKTDYYGRQVPAPAGGRSRFDTPTASARRIAAAVMDIFDRTVNPALLVRRLTVVSADVVRADTLKPLTDSPMQLDLFTDPDEAAGRRAAEQAALDREQRMQLATIAIKKRFGRNAILRGTDFEEGATTRDRNQQVGGHKA